MDYQEAIEALELKEITIEGNAKRVAEFFEGLDIAISAMQELQMYKDNKLCLIPEDVYKKQCEELDEYKEIGTVKGYEGAIKAYNDCYFEKQELELELYKYKQLGDFVEVKKAVEKQNMKMPTYDGNEYASDGTFIWDEWICPNCGTRYKVDYDNYNYCPNCGQHIDRSDEYDS